MKRRTVLIPVIGWLLVAASAIAGSDQSKDEAIQKERTRYEGTWRVFALEVDGVKVPGNDAARITVVNYRDGTWVLFSDGKEVSRGTSQIDPSRYPKTIDFTVTSGSETGQAYLGIYQIEGSLRKLCFAQPGEARPTGFASKPGNGHVVVAFQREMK
jgi:uncharacterized protein (TIGR03067 family)